MTTAVLSPQQIREAYIEKLPDLGIVLSPEFRAALTPHPKEKIVLGGVQAGKSFLTAAEVMLDILSLPLMVQLGMKESREYLYWVVMPSYRTKTKEMHYLRNWCQQLDQLVSFHDPEGAPTRLVACKGLVVVETITAQDMAGIASEPVDGFLAAEAGQMPDEILERGRERTITRRGWIVMSGTLENDSAKPQFVWYGQLGRELLDHPTEKAMAFTLPTWANLAEHPQGRQSPEIVELEEKYNREGRVYAFNRRYGGVPDGVQYPIYEDLFGGEWGAGDVSEWTFLRSRNSGGYDWGMRHPSAIVVVNTTPNDVAVVRDVWMGTGVPDEIVNSRRKMMGQLWNIPPKKWGFDPQLRMAANLEDVQAVTSASRMYRVGLVQSRLKQRKLLFDMDAQEGDNEATIQRKLRVNELFKQMRRVHFIKRAVVGKGEVYDYDRVDDDMAAALENAIEILDGTGKKWNLENFKAYSTGV